jgi:protein SCO1/2
MQEGANNGWHFLTGDQANIERIADAVGFHYQWDDATKQFAHASAIMVATPEGKLSHYFYGISYSARDLRFGLMESSQNKIGSLSEQLSLYCYMYDPTTGKYGAAVMRVLRITGVITLIGIVAMLFLLKPRNRQPITRITKDGSAVR